MKLILMGAPGAGKGTQAEKIAAQYQIPAVSTGEILRGAISAGTELGMTAKSYMDAGQLVPDDIVIGIVKEHLASDTCRNGFILDGFPRSIPQAEALDHLGVELDKVVSLEVDDDAIIERMSGRRVCSGCSKTYHTIYNPSKKGDICDVCGETLHIRADDAPDVVASRLKVYHSTTEPLKHFYEAKGTLCIVHGAERVEDTTKRTFEALGI